MTVKQVLMRRAAEVFAEPSPHVYRGTDYDGAIQATGWWYRPFNRTPIYLGASRNIALETLDNIESQDDR